MKSFKGFRGRSGVLFRYFEVRERVNLGGYFSVLFISNVIGGRVISFCCVSVFCKMGIMVSF